MRKLSTEQRIQLRLKIRAKVEAGGLEAGFQSRLAEELGVTRAYINQIVMDERLRFQNPVYWELRQAKSGKAKGRVVSFQEIVDSLREHPALKTHD